MAPKKEEPNHYFNSPVGHVKDRILIHQGPDVPIEGIFLSVNGFPFLAKAGVEIDIPRPVRQMLDTRIKTITEQDPMTGKNYNRDILRFPYVLIKEGVNLDSEGKVIVPPSSVPEAATSAG